jgi:hypothetical protein
MVADFDLKKPNRSIQVGVVLLDAYVRESTIAVCNMTDLAHPERRRSLMLPRWTCSTPCRRNS